MDTPQGFFKRFRTTLKKSAMGNLELNEFP